MDFSSFDFYCVFKEPAFLPEYKGSTFRGAFGRALKNTVCTLRRQPCAECLLLKQCIYAELFERPAQFSGNQSEPWKATRPFVLRPPKEQRRSYNSGESLTMSALLFDKAVSWLPHLIYSTRLMGENGVGSRTSQGCGKFKLDSVYSGGKEIYSWKTGVLNPQTPPQALSFNQFMPEPAKTLKITLHSPLRFKSQGRFVSQLDFHLLLRSCLRRISQLERKFNRAEPTFDYANLIQRAQKIETISNKARWVDPDRYSSRQKTKMKYGGLLGEITYQGELAEFMPILRYCELVHTGKQTTFGHGQIGLEVLNS